MQFSFKLNTSFQKAAATNYKLGRVTQAMQGKAARMEMAKIIAVTLGTWQALREAGTEPETPQLSPFLPFSCSSSFKRRKCRPRCQRWPKVANCNLASGEQ